jgi:transposase
VIHSVGIDFGLTGPNKVRCLDGQAQVIGSFSFYVTTEGLANLEEHIFRDGSNPTIVFEPTGLVWVLVANYLRARHPEARLVRAKAQKVAALRKYLRGRSKSDRIDALTLAKMPFIDPEQLDEIYLPPAELHALQRLTRQRARLENAIGARKNRIGSIIDGYLPGLRQSFDNRWSSRARAFYQCHLNPFAIIRDGEKALHAFFTKVPSRRKASLEETHRVYKACQDAVSLYELSMQAEMINEGFFADLQDEIARELRLMEAEESEAEVLSKRIEELYRKLHPSNNLRTIVGVGEQTAPVFLAGIGEPRRFRNQSALGNWAGVVPGSRQSSSTEGKGMRMTKAGPSIMKWALYQAGDVGRQWDPQLAHVYYRAMVYHGKNHKQAMGAVMSHLVARVMAVLRENRPYELRDQHGNPISKKMAKKLILSQYQVPEEIRRERRRYNPRKRNTTHNAPINDQGMWENHMKHEAALTPQPDVTPAIPQY